MSKNKELLEKIDISWMKTSILKKLDIQNTLIKRCYNMGGVPK